MLVEDVIYTLCALIGLTSLELDSAFLDDFKLIMTKLFYLNSIFPVSEAFKCCAFILSFSFTCGMIKFYLKR